MSSAAVQSCARRILSDILAGAAPPPRRLGIASVARLLNVGQAQVRQAFDRLSLLGILEKRPNSGTYLTAVTLDRYIDVTQLRAALEGMACRLACGRLTEAELREMRSEARRLDRNDRARTDRTRSRVVADDLRFHLRIARGSGNQALVELLEQQHFLSHYMTVASQVRVSTITAPMGSAHVDIIDALSSGNSDLAERIMREHVLAFVAIVERRRVEQQEQKAGLAPRRGRHGRGARPIDIGG